MRCDICTTTFARIALLVSGAAQTCFDDQVRAQHCSTLNVMLYLCYSYWMPEDVPSLIMKWCTCFAAIRKQREERAAREV